MAQTLFPAGVQAITSLPYVEQLAATEELIDKAGQYKSIMKQLAMDKIFARIVNLTNQYRAALQHNGATVEFATVKAARELGQQHLLELVSVVLGTYHSSSVERTERRAELMAPIFAQNEAVRQYLRVRRSVEDVDPQSGEVAPTASTPTVSPPAPVGAVEAPPAPTNGTAISPS